MCEERGTIRPYGVSQHVSAAIEKQSDCRWMFRRGSLSGTLYCPDKMCRSIPSRIRKKEVRKKFSFIVNSAQAVSTERNGLRTVCCEELDLSLVVAPQTDDFYGFLGFVNFIYQPMLEVDPPGISPV